MNRDGYMIANVIAIMRSYTGIDFVSLLESKAVRGVVQIDFKGKSTQSKDKITCILIWFGLFIFIFKKKTNLI